ncbi:Hypothetical protein NTJ_00165 [Nesidiocoris tenuis]|uniref:Uncharacterized protein n=1 Tax=Nesidiocoris tenuis TaxID=355587 RepID=A0ABN7A911_9HEMI|nr:Hypothetical protein NTJ_00165 [Nesidiocoris tenuis]
MSVQDEENSFEPGMFSSESENSSDAVPLENLVELVKKDVAQLKYTDQSNVVPSQSFLDQLTDICEEVDDPQLFFDVLSAPVDDDDPPAPEPMVPSPEPAAKIPLSNPLPVPRSSEASDPAPSLSEASQPGSSHFISRRTAREVAKERRLKGEEYIGFRGLIKGSTNRIAQDSPRPARELKSRGCSKRCEKGKTVNCCAISEEDRKQIFQTFWKKMSWDSRKMYLRSLVSVRPTKIKTTSKDASRRLYSRTYHLKIKDERVPVCKNMFLNTLGVKDSESNYWIGKFTEFSVPTSKTSQDIICSQEPSTEIGASRSDSANTSQTRSARLARRRHLLNFLSSLPKLPSHYCRKNSNRNYLQLDIRSYAKLYTIYTDHCEAKGTNPVSIRLFLQECKAANVSIFIPRKDRCDTCYKYESKNISEFLSTPHSNEGGSKEIKRRRQGRCLESR